MTKTLLQYEINVNKDKSKKKKLKSAGTLDLIPINHRLVSKSKKNGSTTLLKRSSTFTVDEAKKQLKNKTDPTEENVRRLLLLSNAKLDSSTSEKLLSRSVNKRFVKEKKQKPKEESTIFTEEDFKKFEEEYFVE